MRLWAKNLRIFKRAEMGLECLSVPALLHLLHDLSTSSSLAIFRRRRQVQQALRQAQERLAMCQASHQAVWQCNKRAPWWRRMQRQASAGNRGAAPIGAILSPSHSSCIPGAWWARHSRRHTKGQANARARAPP
jgi:hypothetical protein